jgi:predicted DNA-binding transcriptional regulator AlpA
MEETPDLSSSERTGTVVGMPPDLVGFSGLAEILGVSRATAARYAARPGFPKPVEQTFTADRVWRRRDVERWAKKNPPRPPGRPPKPR